MSDTKRTTNLVHHVNVYQAKLNDLFDVLDLNELEKVIERIILAFKENKTIYIAGNGGSAATASHIHEDLVFFSRYFAKKRLKVSSLTNNIPFITAISNDIGYEDVFVEQLKNNFIENDVLIAISASGNSRNLIRAVEYVKQAGGTAIAFVGFEGGELKDVCDISIFTPNRKGDYGPIEDMHLILGHLIISILTKDQEFLAIANR